MTKLSAGLLLAAFALVGKGEAPAPRVAVALVEKGQATALKALGSASAGRVHHVSAPDLPGAIRTAAPGDVLEVDQGVYRGRVVVDRRLTIRARPGVVIDGEGRGTIVTIAAAGVTLSGFIIRNSGSSLLDDDAAVLVLADDATVADCRIEYALHGIYVLRAGRFRLLRNRIRGKPWLTDENRGNGVHLHASHDGLLAGNEIEEVRDGVYFNYSDANRIVGNRARRLRYGLHYMWSNDNRFVENTFSDNVGGAALMYSHGIVFERNTFERHRGFRAHGVLFKDVDRCRATANRILDNSEGLTLDGAINNVFAGNLVAGNDAAVVEFGNSEGNEFAGNAFIGNGTELREVGQQSSSRWDDGRAGNYWSAYEGYDLEGDGIGDVPFRLQDLFEYLEAERPVLRLLTRTPIAAAIRAAEQSLPVLRQYDTVDRHPLMRVPANVRALRTEGETEPPRGPLMFAALAVLAVGVVLLQSAHA